MSISKFTLLKDRARQLAAARSFFEQKGLFEVDSPLLSSSASIDAHIDLITVLHEGQTLYLHTSPEYAMKRLLSEGVGDTYFLGHVFRHGEWGGRHNPEFTMAEWYRLGFSFEQMIEETVDFARLFLGNLPFSIVSYREAFLRYANCHYLEDPIEKLREILEENGLLSQAEEREELLNLILGTIIEPQLGKDEITVLSYYPADQAALAQLRQVNGEWVAERFELYVSGIELANGYHELADAKEQLRRFEESNQKRLLLGKAALPIDHSFIRALEKGIPDCCGVAVGFDRLMMLRHQQSEIANVLPFAWKEMVY